MFRNVICIAHDTTLCIETFAQAFLRNSYTYIDCHVYTVRTCYKHLLLLSMQKRSTCLLKLVQKYQHQNRIKKYKTAVSRCRHLGLICKEGCRFSMGWCMREPYCPLSSAACNATIPTIPLFEMAEPACSPFCYVLHYPLFIKFVSAFYYVCVTGQCHSCCSTVQ